MDTTTGQLCGQCGKPIYDEDALRCPFCGEQLDISAGAISGMTRGPFRFVGILLALVVIYVFLWLLL
jgi:predicted amidophosphoribosyltransferase